MVGSVLLILLMLLFSAFFSGTEVVFNTVSKLRLKSLTEDSPKRVYKIAYEIGENFTKTLCTILIGNNLVNITASTVSTVIFMKLLVGHDGIASVLSTLVMTLLVLIFGEIIPKILAKEHAEFLVRYVTYPIRILTYILYPIVFVVMAFIRLCSKLWKPKEPQPTVREEELSSLIDTVEEEGVIDEDQGELLQSTIEFPDTTVDEILTPRIYMTYIDIDDDPEEIERVIDSSKYSRIPVFEENIDNIIGILYLNHYYKAMVDAKDIRKLDLRSLLMEPCFIHKTMKLPAALALMRRKKTHMAIVIDEYGGTLGVVTMEDILEELVGDIWDESDEIVTEITQIGKHKYRVSGDMNIDDFFSEIDYKPQNFDCEYSTVGGWAVEKLEADPHVGDTFTEGRIHAKVTEMDDLRVSALTVYVEPDPETEENS